MYAIYAVCRSVDDAIDEDNDLEKLKELEKGIEKAFEGVVVDALLFSAFKETIEQFPSKLKPYKDLVSGMKDDYHFKPIEKESELDEYCYKAAGSVGLMLIPILASEQYEQNKEKLEDVAISLGKAMQITNILRDVREDLMRQRVYFPNEVIEQYQVNIETLRTGIVTPEYKSMVEGYIDKAKALYKVFYDNIELFDKDAAYPTYLAAKFYEGILDEIRKSGYDNLTKRQFVGKFKKYRLTKQAKKALAGKGMI